VAAEYGVSSPTIRLRLDRLIARIEVADEHRNASAFERLARSRYVEGKLDFDTLKDLLEAHRRETEEQS